MKRSLFLMGLATCLALSGLNVVAMQLTGNQSQLAFELGSRMAFELSNRPEVAPHVEVPGVRVTRLERHTKHRLTAEEQVLDSFNKAFPEGFDAHIDPRNALELINKFDDVVKGAIKVVIEMPVVGVFSTPSSAQIQKVRQFYNQVLNSPAGQLYQVLVESKREELNNKMQRR